MILRGWKWSSWSLLKNLRSKTCTVWDISLALRWQDQRKVSMSQQKYIIDLLNKVGMLGWKPKTTPINLIHKLSSDPSRTPVGKGWYQRLEGKLIYLSHSTRHDITYIVGLVSQFMHTPMNCHIEAVSHIFRYLKHTRSKGLLFEKQDQCDWGGSLTHKRSTSGYCTFVVRNLDVEE